MRIAILPDELKVDLSDVKPTGSWTGLVAVYRPLDALELAKFLDAFPMTGQMNEAAHVLVKQQLLRIEGATYGDADVPLDPKDPVHWAALFAPNRGGLAAIGAIWTALLGRTKLDEQAASNSEGQSGSAVIPSSGT